MKLGFFYLAVSLTVLSPMTEAVPLNGLLPYKANDSLVSLTTINEIEELVKQEVFTSLYKAYLGLSPDYPATSCKEIAELRPDYDSGYYWLMGDAGPTGVYCEMNGESIFGEGGGWMRIALFDLTDGRAQCPRGLEYAKIEQKQLCQRPRDVVPGCSTTMFGVQGIQYSKVCGKVIGYQYHFPNAFGPQRYNSDGINGVYVDGVSITHGSPRQHVWTLAAAVDEVYHLGGDDSGCPCIDHDTTFTGTVPSFVGNDYYCETGSREGYEQKYYFTDALWDGEGCGDSNHCCERGGPWFCTELDASTTDDIELRVCTNSGVNFEDIPLEVIEFYIQ